MTTLDDLARVEQRVRIAGVCLGYSVGADLAQQADIIAAYIAAQRERDAERDALRAEVASLRTLVGTVRDTLGLRTINVADIDCEAHSREIGAEVARLTACGWQPIETAPRDGGLVLLYDPDDGRCIGQWINVTGEPGCGWYASSDLGPLLDQGMLSPTHWMPLPEPPKEKGNG